MTSIDLWPNDFGVPDENMPVTILRAQASLLYEKTGWKLEGRVSTQADGENFVHNFYIVAPALDDYHFSLFKVRHQIDPYPLSILSDILPKYEYDVATPDEFIGALKTIFASEKTKKLIVTLLAQTSS